MFASKQLNLRLTIKLSKPGTKFASKLVNSKLTIIFCETVTRIVSKYSLHTTDWWLIIKTELGHTIHFVDIFNAALLFGWHLVSKPKHHVHQVLRK